MNAAAPNLVAANDLPLLVVLEWLESSYSSGELLFFGTCIHISPD